MEVPPWAREAVATFNYVHHALFAALHAALPQLVAVVVSCFIMASLIVAPCFLPLMLWASTRKSRESARPAKRCCMLSGERSPQRVLEKARRWDT